MESHRAKYGVRGIPTLILFKNGEVAAIKVGAVPKSELVEWVESYDRLIRRLCGRNQGLANAGAFIVWLMYR